VRCLKPDGGSRLSLPASTIGAVLRREQMPALCHLDRVTGEVIKGPLLRRAL